MLTKEIISTLAQRALDEDRGLCDLTTHATINPELYLTAGIIANEPLVLCGVDIARAVFHRASPSIQFSARKKDGDFLKSKTVIAVVRGKAAPILTAERTALNFLMNLSGIASFTNTFVQKASRHGVRILDTRKTMPLLRALHKYAVHVGGGLNHRFGLWDGIIIKENHLIATKIKRGSKIDVSSLKNLITNMRKAFHKKIEVEVESIKEFTAVARCKPDIILLDNFALQDIKECVRLRNTHFPKIILEASGGINYATITQVSQTRVDYVSLGCLTHSFQSKDISLDILS